jgi:glycyl-tRNA synthetase beta subunit
MVMDPDPALRDNRLALLRWILAPFARVADFRAIAAAEDRPRGAGAS